MSRILFVIGLVAVLVGIPVAGAARGEPPIRVLFGVIFGLGLLMALMTVVARNLIHAALYLAGFFFVIACQFVLLEAEFLAAIQVLVYIGAVAILLLFGIMLTRNIQGDETTVVAGIWKVAPALAGLAVFVVLVYGIGGEVAPTNNALSWTSVRSRPPLLGDDGKPTDARGVVVADMGHAVGIQMVTRYMIPFEVAGLLLTAALVGAVALAQGEGDDEAPRDGALLTARPGMTAGPGAGGNGQGHAPAGGVPEAEALLTPTAAGGSPTP